MSTWICAGDRVGPWIFRDLLGEGATAAVYRVEHEKLGVVRAVKVSTSDRRALTDRLRAEGRFLARLSHPNVVSVHDILDVHGRPALLMDYIQGPTLQQLLAQGPLDPDSADRIIRGILAGVAAAHDLGLVHRDLKPGNILLSIEDGLVPKVADFGLAKDLGAGSQMTAIGSVFGTPEYMSPEQLRDSRSVDARSDVFALGAILYEVISGRPAFADADIPAIFSRITSGRFEPLEAPLSMSRQVTAIYDALSLSPDKRPPDARALLERWTGEPVERTVISPIVAPRLVTWARSVTPAPQPLAASTFTEPPERPTPPRRLFAAGALFAALSSLPLATLALLCAGGLWDAMKSETETILVPVPVPQHDPASVQPPPPPEDPAPQQEVQPPLPQSPPPEPRRAPPPRPAVAPERPAVEPEQPAPPAPPAPKVSSHFTVRGDDVKVLLRRGGRDFIPGDELPPGSYEVFAMSNGSLERKLSLEVVPGRDIVIRCALNRCKEEAP